MGKPEICLHSDKDSTFLRTKDRTYYTVDLKIFRPGENDRLAYLQEWEAANAGN